MSQEKVPFDTIFEKDGDLLKFKVKTRISGITFPKGLDFEKRIAGIAWADYSDRDLAVATDKDVMVILGIF